MNDQPLSDAGLRRGEAILAEAVALGRTIARRRRVRRRLAVVATAGVIAIITGLMLRVATTNDVALNGHSPRPSSVVPGEGEKRDAREDGRSSPTTVARRDLVTIITPDPMIVSRYATRPTPPIVRRIGDDELLRSLGDAGIRGGLATVGERTSLLLDRTSIP